MANLNYLHLKGMLSSEHLSAILNLINQADFETGTASATGNAAQVKDNLQIRAEDNPHAQQIAQIVMQAISTNVSLQSSVLPKAILPPLVSKYVPGMKYGMHVDSPLMGSQYTIRTDVGMTLFLSEPDTYEGGELLVKTETGDVKFKLAAGDAIVYPTTKLHQVLPVIKGVRMAVVTWMQSAVRDGNQREILSQLNYVIQSLGESQVNERLELQQAYSNLLRMWAEL